MMNETLSSSSSNNSINNGSENILYTYRKTTEWSDEQFTILYTLNRLPALLSIIGSSYIIYLILRPSERSEKLSKMYHRLMLALSANDLLSSIAVFIGSWAMPKDNVHALEMRGNVGTWGTCRAQGFFVTFGYFNCLFYNAVLSLYFLLYVKYRWREDRFRAWDLTVHGLAIVLSLVVSLCPLWFDAYNVTIKFCWIQSYPINCESFDEIDCIYADNAKQLLLYFMIVPVTLSFVLIAVFMSNLYYHVQKTEALVASYRSSSSALERKKKTSLQTRKVFKMAQFYVGAHFFIWFPSMVNYTISKSSNNVNYYSTLVSTLTLPIQGILNVCIYTKTSPFMFAQNISTNVMHSIRNWYRNSSFVQSSSQNDVDNDKRDNDIPDLNEDEEEDNLSPIELTENQNV